jgi:hypothetical protein
MKKFLVILLILASVACNNNATITGVNNADTVVLTPEFDGQQSSPKEPKAPKADTGTTRKK